MARACASSASIAGSKRCALNAPSSSNSYTSIWNTTWTTRTEVAALRPRRPTSLSGASGAIVRGHHPQTLKQAAAQHPSKRAPATRTTSHFFMLRTPCHLPRAPQIQVARSLSSAMLARLPLHHQLSMAPPNISRCPHYISCLRCSPNEHLKRLAARTLTPSTTNRDRRLLRAMANMLAEGARSQVQIRRLQKIMKCRMAILR